MNLLLPPGLVFAIGLCIVHVPQLVAQAPPLREALPVRPAGSPPIPPTKPPSLPTRSSALPGAATTPIAAIVPSAARAHSSPLPVQPPSPAARIAPPSVPAAAPFLSGLPDVQRFERAVPRMEVWRTGSDVPQRPARRSGRFAPLLINGVEPVTVLLHFHPLLAGKTVEVIPGDGVTVQPVNRFLQIGAKGEGILLVALEETKASGELGFRVDNITTTLRFVRAPLRALAERERAIGMEGR